PKLYIPYRNIQLSLPPPARSDHWRTGSLSPFVLASLAAFRSCPRNRNCSTHLQGIGNIRPKLASPVLLRARRIARRPYRPKQQIGVVLGPRESGLRLRRSC